MDRLLLHEVHAARGWPSTDRDEILVVAHRDLHVARHNVAELTRYLDLHYAHLSSCAGAMDNSLPLMAVETFPRLPGGCLCRAVTLSEPGTSLTRNCVIVLH